MREAMAAAAVLPFQLHVAVPGEEEVLLHLLDDAVRWLTSRGNTGQWGTRPFSTNERRILDARRWVASGGAMIAVLDDEPVGGLVLGEAPDYVDPAQGPEVYIVLLVGTSRVGARGVGRVLLDVAELAARRLSVARIRVDCFAGNDGALVRYYESAGFVPTSSFVVGNWPGQVLERQVAPLDGPH